MPELIALADDLTGALETGAQWSAEAIQCSVSTNASIPAGTDSAVLNLATRHLPPDAAKAAVRLAVAAARPLGLEYLFLKTDSTLRGPIPESFGVLLSEFPERKLVYVPAYPAQGRTVRDGVLFVHGVPLSKTSFSRDVLNPARQDCVVTLLRLGLGTPPAIARSPAQARALLAEAGTRIVVCDGDSEDDLIALAEVLRPAPTRWIVAGTAAIGRYWARTLPVRRSLRSAAPAGSVSSGLIVIGSRHPASRLQGRCAEASGIPIYEARGPLSRKGAVADELANALRSRGWAVLWPPRRVSGSPLDTAAKCGAIAGEAVQRSSPDVLVIFGGDTAEAVLAALGCHVAHPVGDLLPGVPISQIEYRGRPLLLVTKAGGFGDERTLCRILDELRRFA